MKALQTALVVLMAFLVMSLPALALQELRPVKSTVRVMNPTEVTGEFTRETTLEKKDALRERRGPVREQVVRDHPGLTREELVAKLLESMKVVIAEHYFKFSQLVEPIVQHLERECGVSKDEMKLFKLNLDAAKESLGSAQGNVITAWMDYKWHKYGEALKLLKDAQKQWGIFKIQLTGLVHLKNALEEKYGCRKY